MIFPNEPVQSFFGSPLGGVSSGYPVLWPCSVLSVTMGKVSGGEINAFERAVLRLAGIGIIQTEQLLDILCLEKDFLRFWVERLKQTDYLQSSGELSDKGRTYIQGGKNIGFQTVFVYREDLSGAILPFFTTASPQFLQRDENSFYFGSEGDKKRIKEPFILKRPQKPFGNTSETTVRAVATIHNKKLRAGCAGEVAARENLIMNEDGELKIQEATQKIYLHCVARMSQNGQEIEVMDPFGSGSPLRELAVSPGTLGQIRDYLWRKLTTRNRPAQETPGSDDPIDGLPSWLRQLPAAADALQAFWAHQNEPGYYAARERLKAQRKFLSNLSGSLESFLRQILHEQEGAREEPSLTSLLEAIQLSRPATNTDIAATAARKMGFEANCKDLFHLEASDSRRYAEGRGNLRTLLNLNFYVGACAPLAHPLAAVAEQYPSLPEKMRHLLTARNTADHSDFDEDPPGASEMLDWWEMAAALFLTYITEDSGKNAIMVLKNQVATPLKNAEDDARDFGALADYYPIELLQRMDRDMYEALAQSEMAYRDYGLNGDDLAGEREVSEQAVVPLASFCQFLLKKSMQDCPPCLEGSLVLAQEKCAQAGFHMAGNGLPDTLSTVKITMIEKSLAGKKNTSLGSECIAWLCRMPADTLNRVARERPALMMDLAELACLRGHGTGMIPAVSARDIRARVYTDCLPLLEQTASIAKSQK